jgi:hypothetical protein
VKLVIHYDVSVIYLIQDLKIFKNLFVFLLLLLISIIRFYMKKNTLEIMRQMFF